MLKCEQTVNCWIVEADKREGGRATQKELACRHGEDKKNETWEEKVTASHRPTNRSVGVAPHAPPPYHHHPVAELQALKVDSDLDCSPLKRPTAPQKEEDPEIITKPPMKKLKERECP